MLVRLSDADKSEYKGKLIIPENVRQRVRVFEVVDCGPMVRNFTIGDKVLISFYTGIYIDLIHDVEPENLRIIEDEEVIAKIIED
jgi:co-chaperonin GroES (HSP10)